MAVSVITVITTGTVPDLSVKSNIIEPIGAGVNYTDANPIRLGQI